MAHIKALTSRAATQLLNDIRGTPNPNDFVSIEQLKKSSRVAFQDAETTPALDRLKDLSAQHSEAVINKKDGKRQASLNESEKSAKQKKVPYTLLMAPSELERLKDLSSQDGETVSFHIRQAVRQYLNRMQ